MKQMVTVKKIRERMGLSQVELAKLLGKSPRTIQRWEADETRLDMTILLALKQVEAEAR